jgi:hypothetical protein
VSTLEERLRDAYQGAAATVSPEAIRDLDQTAAPRPRRTRPASRWRRTLTPLAAAAAVTLIVVLATVILPHASTPSQDRNRAATPASVAAPKYLIADGGTSPLEVRNAATGALVATITLPTEPGSQTPTGNPAADGRTYVTAVATADGYHYLAAVYRSSPCRSWLYQFQLDGQGQPSAVTPLAAFPTTGSELYGLTVSGDGQTIAYATVACMGSAAQPSYVAVTNVHTGQTKRWSTPARNSVNNVSLTADGGQLTYSLQLDPSVVRVIPTSAAPGVAADRGRTLVRSTAFGPTDWVSFAAISPDGRTLYFTTYPQNKLGPGTGQVRVLDLATGRSRVLDTQAGQPGLITADPAVRHFLLQIQQGTSKVMLASLDLATGHVTYLPSGWTGLMGDVITW